jgi:hypothetical protein
VNARQERLRLASGCYGHDLPAIEVRIQRIVQAIFLDRHGFVRGGVHARTLAPYTPRDMRHIRPEEMFCANAGMPRKWKPLVMNYEEADMATGDYLLGLVHKCKVTADPAVRRQARAAFEGIRRLCHNAFTKNPYGRGWLPKPYGGIIDVGEVFECSVDQYAKISLGLDAYSRELADSRERAAAEDILVAFADWWIEHGYTSNYFGNCCWWWRAKLPHACGLFLYLLALAQRLTGRRKYLREFYRIMQHKDALLNLPRVEVNAANLTIECLERLMALKPGHRRTWLASMRACWEFTRARTQPEGYTLLDLWGSKTFKRVIRVNTGGRAACSGATVAEFLAGRARIRRWTRDRLMRCNHMDMFYHLHPTSQRMPRAYAFEHDDFSGHHFTAWLHAYWKLRRNEEARRSEPLEDA